MTYLISDIHGEYSLFLKLLNSIHFSSSDKMIICGDILEKGPHSIKLLKFVRNHSNIVFIIGNHEYDFLKYYTSIMMKLDDGFDEKEVLKKINSFFSKEEDTLNWEDLDWLENCAYYYETEDYICVHAGIGLNSNSEVINPKDNDVRILVYDRNFKDPNLIINNSKCVFFGHTPTGYLIDDYRIITYKRKYIEKVKSIRDFYKIHLDCGTSLSGVLGCFCIENCKEYYVKKDF